MITRNELLHNLALAQLKLANAKIEEMRWRMLVATTLFKDVNIGTNWTPEGDCKLVAKINISFSKDKELINRTLSEAGRKFPAAPLTAVFDWQYTFNESEYHALPNEAKIAVAPLLTIKPATPTVEVKKAV